jgi:glutamate racemase
MDDRDRPIGLFDSGIGGLSVLKQFIRFLPNEKYVYLGDTARVPYGNKSDATVIEYSKQCARFLLSKDVKLIVIACNTASSIALNIVREISPVPVIGMISPAAGAALRTTQNMKIGVIGTRATIESKAYANEIKSLMQNEDVEVYSKACPLFVPLVEEGMIRHEATRKIAEEYLGEFQAHGVDTLVLGCTHYPLLKQMINEILPNVNLIDSGEHSAVIAIRMLAEQALLLDEQKIFTQQPNIDFFVTDVPSTFFNVANIFLGFPVSIPQKINLEA